MKRRSLVFGLLAMTMSCAGVLESAVWADSHGKFPGKGSLDAYNRSLAPMNEGARKYKEHDFNSAIEFSRQAISIYPLDSATHNNLGNALRRAGRFEEAIVELQRAIALEPSYLSAWLGLGAANESLGRLQEAERCYRRGLEIEPNSYGALFDIGDVLRQQGRLVEARNWLLRAKNSPSGKQNLEEVNNALKLCEKKTAPPGKEASNQE